MATEAALRSGVANWLVPYVGLTEGDSKHKALVKLFNDSKLCTRYTMTVNDAWCAMATSDAFIAEGLTSIFPCVECSCARMITLAKAAGIWVENDAYTPKVGDVVLYDWDDSGSGDNTGTPDHVGIVYSISGTSMKIIEGNKSDTVGYRSLTVNGKYIRGYITPKYSSVATSASSNSSSSSSGNTSYCGKGIGTAVAKTTMYIRDKASTSGNKYGTISKGTAVEVLEVLSSGWYKIVWPGASCGYAYTSNASGKYYDYTSNGSASSSSSFAIGDKVSVTGTIYGNGNGTGGTIKKTNATMYVVSLADSSKYTYYIGLAKVKGGTRQGWAKPSILTKA